MLLALLFLALSLAFGFTVLRWLPLQWHKPEYVAAGASVGIFLGTWIAFLCIWFFGYGTGFFISLVILALISLANYYQAPKINLHPWPTKKSDLIAWGLVTVISIIIFSNLLFTHMLQQKNGALFSGGSTWGDIALHLALLTNFATQTHFTWSFPILANANLAYPFLIDFTSGLLYRFGLNLQTALIIPAWIYILASVQFIFFFSYRWFKNSLAAAITVLLFFINGGIGGLVPFWQDWQTSGQDLFTFLGNMQKEYAHVIESNMVFSNIIVDYILPQRSFVNGLPFFGLIAIFMAEAWQNRHQAPKLLAAAAIIGGLLPLAHVHTFFVIAGIMLWLAIYDAIKHRQALTVWTTSFLAMLVIAAPQVIWQLKSNYTPTFGHWQLGWMTGAGQSPVIFWLANLGLAAIFLFTNFLIIRNFQTHRQFWLLFYGALATLFLMTNLYIFQPNAYDNMKFMVYAYLGIVLIAAVPLAEALQKSAWHKITSIAIVISLTIVGVLSVWRETYVSWPFLSANEVAGAEQLKKIIPPDATILTGNNHNHFVPTLTGHPIVMGYPGWLWTYGFDYVPIQNDEQAIFSGKPNSPQLITKYHIDFVVISPAEISQFKANQTYFNTHATLVMQTSTVKVYDVRQLH